MLAFYFVDIVWIVCLLDESVRVHYSSTDYTNVDSSKQGVGVAKSGYHIGSSSTEDSNRASMDSYCYLVLTMMCACNILMFV